MFDGPQRAIRCAMAIRDAVQALGIEVRAGLHTGECELRGDDIGGIGVHIGARVSALAGPNEVLVSSTLRDLVIGSGLEFEDRGTHNSRVCPVSGVCSPSPLLRTVGGRVPFGDVVVVEGAFFEDVALLVRACGCVDRFGHHDIAVVVPEPLAVPAVAARQSWYPRPGKKIRLPALVLYVLPVGDVQITVPSGSC